MRKLITVGIAFALLFLAKAAAPGPLKLTLLSMAGVLCGGMLIHGVIKRRRAGQSWNGALAGNTKLLTGNVWLDGMVFIAVLLLCGAIAYFVLPRV